MVYSDNGVWLLVHCMYGLVEMISFKQSIQDITGNPLKIVLPGSIQKFQILGRL